VLANMTASLALILFNQTSLTVALPSIRRELHVGTTGLVFAALPGGPDRVADVHPVAG